MPIIFVAKSARITYIVKVKKKSEKIFLLLSIC